MQRIVLESLSAPAANDFRRNLGTDRTMDVLDRRKETDRLSLFDRTAAEIEKLVIELFFQRMVLHSAVAAKLSGFCLRHIKHTGKINIAALGRVHFLLPEQIGTAHHVFKFSESEARHDFTNFFSDKEEVVDHMLGFAFKAFAQFRILCGNAHRAGVQMALAHHEAAFDNERCRGKPELVRAKERADHNISAGLNLTVHLDANSVSETVDHKSLLRFRKPLLPRCTRKLD